MLRRIVFDVVVYPDVPDGTVISNQAFLNALAYGIADQPSDDPRTEVPDDPTRDVVGNLPLLFAAKSAALQIDAGSPGIVDPGDTSALHDYRSITTAQYRRRSSSYSDLVPVDTTYVEDSLRP